MYHCLLIKVIKCNVSITYKRKKNNNNMKKTRYFKFFICSACGSQIIHITTINNNEDKHLFDDKLHIEIWIHIYEFIISITKASRVIIYFLNFWLVCLFVDIVLLHLVSPSFASFVRCNFTMRYEFEILIKQCLDLDSNGITKIRTSMWNGKRLIAVRNLLVLSFSDQLPELDGSSSAQNIL